MKFAQLRDDIEAGAVHISDVRRLLREHDRIAEAVERYAPRHRDGTVKVEIPIAVWGDRDWMVIDRSGDLFALESSLACSDEIARVAPHGASVVWIEAAVPVPKAAPPTVVAGKVVP